MNTSIQTNPAANRCPSCGLELPAGTAPDLCPQCLLRAGLGTQAGADTEVVEPSADKPRGLPQAGELFGHYRIVRALGQGGMGVVFEAEDLESDRRVALKILGHTLDSPDARKRFLREGQLAASINHPNSVYVFGTEEVGGTPVISMELVTGGTLRERVLENGPMPAAGAVESMLQVIAGLGAAQQIGILHRDIKPSNCFISEGGVVKIGDFGLSISTSVRTESNLTQSGALFGTPGFSSPEQLRGDELTVRSDIYAVGVTLYYLLTGRLPFEAANMVQLIATVLEQRAPSPARWREGLPRGLCRAVLRCLEKDAGERFASYAKLREALSPYAVEAPVAATPGPRFLAGLIDVSVVTVIAYKLTQWIWPEGWFSTVLLYSLLWTGFAVPEAIWGATLGKFVCGMRVTDADRHPLASWRVMLRTVLFLASTMLSMDLIYLFLVQDTAGGGPSSGLLAFAIWFSLVGITFSTVRRANGFAALHDLATRTRVVLRGREVARPVLPRVAESPMPTDKTTRVGPYYLLGESGLSGDAKMLLAYDARLLRKVWIREVPPGTAAVEGELRMLSTPGRLRWLNSRRTEREAWDAYEALSGAPLLELIKAKQSWASVRFWLADIADELAAAREHGGLAFTMSLANVWITEQGRAKLLDFPAPRLMAADAEACVAGGPREFLKQVAVCALHGEVMDARTAWSRIIRVPIPLHAREWIDSLTSARDAGNAAKQLGQVLDKPASVSKGRRAAMLAGGLWFPVYLPLTLMALYPATFPPSGHGLLQGPATLASNTTWVIALGWRYAALAVVGPCLLAAVAFRGGALMRGLGVTLVNRDGSRASRFRVLWRNFVAWFPVIVAPVIFMILKKTIGEWPAIAIVLAAPATLAVISLTLSERSLQDRIGRTYLVPR